MDNVTLEQLAQRSNLLSEKFCGVWSADNFPAMKQGESFQIVNTELSCRPGRHWILLCTQKDFARRGKAVIVFWDSLGKKPKTYKKFYLRLLCLYDKVVAVNHPLQSRFSNCCGLFCILMADHLPFTSNNKKIAKTLPKSMVGELSLVRVINHHYKTDYSFEAVWLIQYSWFSTSCSSTTLNSVSPSSWGVVVEIVVVESKLSSELKLVFGPCSSSASLRIKGHFACVKPASSSPKFERLSKSTMLDDDNSSSSSDRGIQGLKGKT